jgi:hypothetical protein
MGQPGLGVHRVGQIALVEHLERGLDRRQPASMGLALEPGRRASSISITTSIS